MDIFLVILVHVDVYLTCAIRIKRDLRKGSAQIGNRAVKEASGIREKTRLLYSTFNFYYYYYYESYMGILMMPFFNLRSALSGPVTIDLRLPAMLRVMLPGRGCAWKKLRI